MCTSFLLSNWLLHSQEMHVEYWWLNLVTDDKRCQVPPLQQAFMYSDCKIVQWIGITYILWYCLWSSPYCSASHLCGGVRMGNKEIFIVEVFSLCFHLLMIHSGLVVLLLRVTCFENAQAFYNEKKYQKIVISVRFFCCLTKRFKFFSKVKAREYFINLTSKACLRWPSCLVGAHSEKTK